MLSQHSLAVATEPVGTSPPLTRTSLRPAPPWAQREFKFALELPDGWQPVLAPSQVALFFANGPAHGIWSDNVLVLAQPHHDRVLFAGEATDPVWATRVGGAYASGLRAAREALAVLGAKR